MEIVCIACGQPVLEEMRAEMGDQSTQLLFHHVGCLRADQAGYATITDRVPDSVGAP